MGGGDIKTALREDFAALGPEVWDDVPRDSLPSYLKGIFAAAEELANSIPLPASHDTTFPEASSHEPARSSADTVVQAHATALDAQHEAAQKTWGKPINKPHTKDNPLHVWMYKTAGHDKRGAWFARRSIHKGLPFPKWKSAMRREFLTSLKVQKGPGSGAVRGLAGDRRIETRAAEGTGTIDAWLLSSAFPGPVSPRDFVSMVCTSDNALTEASVVEGAEDKTPPRHFMVVSKPLTHPDAPDREKEGLVRGYYESLELAREIPGTGTDGGPNLVEWIMVTRSDPGGGIPRFMVERGTPGSIVSDVGRWLDWAISRADESADDDDTDGSKLEKELEEANGGSSSKAAAASQPEAQGPSGQDAPPPYHDGVGQSHGGHDGSAHGDGASEGHQGYSSLLGNLTTAVGSTVAGYLPHMPHLPHLVYGEPRGEHGGADGDGYSSDTSSSSSSADSERSFASAREGEHPHPHPHHHARQESDNLSTTSTMPIGPDGQPMPRNHHERELVKLQARRLALDEKMAKTREEDSRRSKEAEAREEGEARKQQDKAERERQKAEEKYAKELRRLEEKRQKEERKAEEAREKEERKAEERRRKAKEKDVVARAQSERDEAREKLKMAESEMRVLRQQVEELQRENTLLVQGAGAGETGMELVGKVRRDGASSSRPSSRSSGLSGKNAHKATASVESAAPPPPPTTT